MPSITQVIKKFSLSVLILLSLAYLLSFSYILSHASINNFQKSDVVIVLGSRTRKGNSPNPCLVARVQIAAQLYQAGEVKKVLVSGGYNPDDHYFEADDMQKIALDLGVNLKDILKERNSTSTYENLLFSQKIMTDQKLKSAIIVSEPYHLPRADLVADKLNLPHTLAPAANTPCWNTGFNHVNYYLFRDALALLVYKVQGKI